MSDVGSSEIEALLPSAIDRVEAAPDWLISGSTSFGCRAWISPLGSTASELFECLRQSGVDDGPMQSAHVHPSLRVNVRCVTPPRDDDARDQHQQQDHVEDEIRMCLRSDTDRDRDGSDQRAEKRESLHSVERASKLRQDALRYLSQGLSFHVPSGTGAESFRNLYY